MNEMQWLLDLLLKHKLSAALKTHVAERLSEICNRPNPSFMPQIVHGVVQAPSTAAILAKQALEPDNRPEPIVAVTVQAREALASRERAIEQALSGKREPGRQSPRKF